VTLRRREPATRGIRRSLRKDLRQAARDLTGGGHASDRRLHDVRKILKRARAELRLVRAMLGDETFDRENRALRDAGRPLRTIRDAKCLVETIDALAARATGKDLQALRRERQALVAARRRVRARFDASGRPVAAARRLVDQELARIDRWPSERRGWSVLGPGLKHVYRAGRKALAAARRRPTVESLHELRKQAKYLWHAVQLLERVHPRAMKTLATRIHRLSDRLGEDHDLAVLVERCRRRGVVTRLAAERRAKLREDALRLARRVFDPPPRRFAAGVKRRWKAWRKAR